MSEVLGRVSINRGELYLDGCEVFRVPIGNEVERVINVAGVVRCEEDGGKIVAIYVGTGGCCHGHVYKLNVTTAGVEVDDIFSVDLCVQDLLVVGVDHGVAGVNCHDAVVVVGSGCCGSGVRLVSTYGMDVREVVSGDGQREITGANFNRPRFRIEGERVFADYYPVGHRPRPGRTRDSKLPSLLVNTGDEEFYVAERAMGSIDVTAQLIALGAEVADLSASSLERLYSP